MSSQRRGQTGGGATPAAGTADGPTAVTAEAAPAAPVPAGPIRVRAKATGFYKGGRIRAGKEFQVDSERHLGTWMERLDGTGASATQEPAKDAEQQQKVSTTDQDVI